MNQNHLKEDTFLFDILKKQCPFNEISAISLVIFMLYMILKEIIAYIYLIASDGQFGGISFSFDTIDLLLALIIYFYYRRSKEPFTNQNNFAMSWQKSLRLGLVMAVGAKLLTMVLVIFITVESSNQVALESQLTLPFLVFTFSVALVAPIAEEIVFRGVIQHGIFKNKWLGVIVSSFIFAFVHVGFDWLAMIDYFILGFSIGCAYRLTGRLYIAILMHMLNNAVAVVFMYLF